MDTVGDELLPLGQDLDAMPFVAGNRRIVARQDQGNRVKQCVTRG
jgi:hypothetical protein